MRPARLHPYRPYKLPHLTYLTVKNGETAKVNRSAKLVRHTDRCASALPMLEMLNHLLVRVWCRLRESHRQLSRWRRLLIAGQILDQCLMSADRAVQHEVHPGPGGTVIGSIH